MKLIILLLNVCLIFSSGRLFSKEITNNDVVWAVKAYSKKIKKEKDIVLTMYGVDASGADKIYDGKVHLIDVGYRIDKKIKFDEARVLFYSIVNGLIQDLNENESIRKCFYNYPVTYQDLYFRLSFDYERQGYLTIGDVSMIAILENKIKYFIVEEDEGNIQLNTKSIVPDVQVVTGCSPKTRCITKNLPEKIE
jgi:hypothetical protein